MNPLDFQPLGNWYLVKLDLPENASAGGIALPDTVISEVQSGIVEAHGPGKLLDNDTHHDLQARIGDQVITRFEDWQHLPDGYAFVCDERLVAMRGYGFNPDFDVRGNYSNTPTYWDIRACNDYVLVRPDAAKKVDEVTGATVSTASNGILIAAGSLVGGQVREHRRGQEILAEVDAIVASREYKEQPSEFYRHRILHQYYRTLSPWEYQAFTDAVHKRDKKGQIPIRPMLRAGAGEVVDVGPKVNTWFNDALRTQSTFTVGDRVHFDGAVEAVALFTEEGTLWALPERALAAVEVES